MERNVDRFISGPALQRDFHRFVAGAVATATGSVDRFVPSAVAAATGSLDWFVPSAVATATGSIDRSVRLLVSGRWTAKRHGSGADGSLHHFRRAYA